MNTININRRRISRQEIERFKNFQSLSAKYNNLNTSTLKNNFWMNIIVSVVVVGIAVFTAMHFLKRDTPKPITESSFVNPPIPNADIPYITFDYNTNSDTILVIGDTKIEIKKNSIVDENGNTIKGTAKISYREFMNPAQIMLSGIPMEYDSAGNKSTFSSAGMIEIKGEAEGKPVFIAEDKGINISFKSPKAGNDYNLYYLDTIKKNWVYMGKDEIEVQKDKEELNIKKTKKTKATEINNPKEPIKPEAPRLADAQKWNFTIDVIPEEFPELAGYSQTQFEIDESYKKYNPAHSKIEWNDVKIEKANEPNKYFITFTKDTIHCKYLAQPVLNEKDYKKELAGYEKKYAEYMEAAKKAKLEEEANRTKIIVDTAYNPFETQQNIYRSFTIQKFGIWNCDKVFKQANKHISNPVLKINDTIYERNVFLADFGNNALMSIYPGQEIRYDSGSKNYLIMIKNNNQIAVFWPKDFEKLVIKNQKNILNLALVKKQITTPKDIEEILK
jgi:hypothetical protein